MKSSIEFDGDPGDQRHAPDLCIDLSISPDDTDGAEAMVKMADEAMYMAKKDGRNNYT